MNKTAIVIALIAAALAATWMYLWYNKDRYQFVDGSRTHYAEPTAFDRNTGEHK